MSVSGDHEFLIGWDHTGRNSAARRRDLLEEFLQAFRILALVRIHLGVGAFQINWPEHSRRTMSGAGHENYIKTVAFDQTVQMRPHKGQCRARAPVTKQAMLDVLDLERLLEQRVVAQVDHADREVVAGAPPGINQEIKLTNVFNITSKSVVIQLAPGHM